MVQGYYTLEEASQFLGMAEEELKQKARSKELRSFQDRGTLHFRIQDIQELARQRSMTSDPDLPLGDASLPKMPEAPRTPRAKGGEVPDVFDFEFDAAAPGDSGGPKSGRKPAPKSGPRTPNKPVAEGSDSDVRLISEGGELTFAVAGDSNVKLPGKDSGTKPPTGSGRSSKLGGPGSVPPRPSKLAPPPPPPKSGVPAPGSGRTKASSPGSGARPAGPATPHSPSKSPKPGSAPQPADSGVRLVPMDSDSDVRIVGSSEEIELGGAPPASAADSSVRIEALRPPAAAGEGMMLTEEINLDEELQKQEESLNKQAKKPTRVKPKSELKFPGGSPFELSESDLDLPAELQAPPSGLKDGSSDYDLVPAEDGTILQESGSDDFSLELPDDNAVIGADDGSGEASLTGPSSGLTLDNPNDAGISLEEGAAEGTDEVDFDLSLEVEATPRPSAQPSGADSSSEFELNLDSGEGPAPAPEESSSEFELSLDPGSAEAAAGEAESSSEFELSLDAGEPAPGLDSDSEFELSLDAGDLSGEVSGSSEFELTLDDSGSSLLADEDAPQVKASAEEEQDVFETDFEMPDLSESGEGSADADLESSDFDLALDDSEIATDEESGSQVVPLEEEELVEAEGEEGAEPLLEEEGEIGDLEIEEEEAGEEEEVGAARGGKVRVEVRKELVQPAPWGVLPVIFMLPCVVVMILVGLLGFELVQSASGYKAPGTLTKAIGGMLDLKIK